jgi:hypothetical protein
MELLRSNIFQLLKVQYRQSEDVGIPEKRIKSLWRPENNYGFLLGITHYGEEFHLRELEEALTNSEFQEAEDDVIERFYMYYIQPFKQHNGSRCSTPTSQTMTRDEVESDSSAVRPIELKHKDLKQAVLKRDGVCVFCWADRGLQAAHIIAQKNTILLPFQTSIFERAGVPDKHQVQNGLLLCSNCHLEFDALKIYVEPGSTLLLMVVNSTSNDQDKEWKKRVRMMKHYRKGAEEDWVDIDNRMATNSDGDMELFFLNNDQSLQPNRKGLEFQKSACLIWRMAGGAETDEELCSDDDDTDHIQISIEKCHRWNSSATLFDVKDALQDPNM